MFKYMFVLTSDTKTASKVLDLMEDGYAIVSVAGTSNGVHYILFKDKEAEK